jgi:hypothetical protein
MLCEVQEPPRRHRCPISMIMAVDRGCGLRDDKLVENQVLRVISTDLASCWIIVRVLMIMTIAIFLTCDPTG